MRTTLLIKSLSVLLLFSCIGKKTKSRAHMREDGFYYRTKNKDLRECLRFYPQGKVQVMHILAKNEDIIQYANAIMCVIDTNNKKKYPHNRWISSYLKNSISLTFKANTFAYFTPYNTKYELVIWNDSLVGTLSTVDSDKERMKDEQSISVTFIFHPAVCDSTLKVPHKEYDYDPPKYEKPNNSPN